MAELYGFRLTADLVGLAMLFFSVLYFFFGEGIAGFKQSKCTNYGEPIVFEPELLTSLNRTRIALNTTDDPYMRMKLH